MFLKTWPWLSTTLADVVMGRGHVFICRGGFFFFNGKIITAITNLILNLFLVGTAAEVVVTQLDWRKDLVAKKWCGGKNNQAGKWSSEAGITDKSKGKINFKQVQGTSLFKLLFKCVNKIFLKLSIFLNVLEEWRDILVKIVQLIDQEYTTHIFKAWSIIKSFPWEGQSEVCLIF